ncbi:hypothetical protein [Nocardia transvalensis]|uniref:hypothetical protein n=1 Tax=Nocardia transvalensis TaxID=37333 RepID=UPI0018959000|nr:hypothetical protein [Nocardia transvalensis]MBF6333473.1 hypothetical protein [Nocardia transvalensis]
MITRDEQGVFEASLDDGRFVRGWSPTAEEMRVILGRYGVRASEMDGPAVSSAVVEEPDRVYATRLDDGSEAWDRRVRAGADAPQRAVLRDALSQLRSRIPADPEALSGWLAAEAESVNVTAPQVDAVSVFHRPGAVRCRDSRAYEAVSECLEWVDTRAVLSTPDRVWGTFARMGADRRSLAGFCTSLKEADSAQGLEAWIDDFVIGRLRQPVQLVRVEGPAGPVYELRSDGTHRTHLARIFGLPLLAVVKTCALPRPLSLADHPDRPEGGVFGEGSAGSRRCGPGCASVGCSR